MTVFVVRYPAVTAPPPMLFSHLLRPLVGLLMFGAFAMLSGRGLAAPPTFEQGVLPILTARCINCHGEGEPEGKLDLRSKATILRGGESGPAIRPGGPGYGPLYDQVRGDAMPPGKKSKLTIDEKEIIRAWIANGAPLGKPEPVVVKRPTPPAPLGPPREPAIVTAEVDRLIDARLAEAKITKSPLADDAEFLRRVTIDLIGRIPTAAEARTFLDDTAADKRAALVDRLLASPEFGRHLGQLWHNRIAPLDANNTRRYDESLFLWLAAEVNRNRPWSEIVAAMLTAEGELVNNRNREPSPVPAIGLFMATADEQYPQADKITASVAQLFLGTQVQCAQCHNHPFAAYKQDDFWGMTVFFARVGYDRDIGQSRNDKQQVILHETMKAVIKGGKPSPLVRPDASIEVPESRGRIVKARFLDGDEPELKPEEQFLPKFAAWATAKENPQFAKAGMNRVWGQLFGRGLVNPVSDIHEGNPPSHPELFETLAREFAASGYDLKRLYRTLCNTAAYQRSSIPLAENKTDETLYSHATLKMMTPEVLHDSAVTVYKGEEAAFEKELDLAATGFRSIRDPARAQFLNNFTSQEAGEDPTRYTHGVTQALRMMNSAAVVRGDGAQVKRVTAREFPAERRLEEYYLMTLARRPTPAEIELWQTVLQTEKDPGRASRTVLWTLLNGSEFVFNH